VALPSTDPWWRLALHGLDTSWSSNGRDESPELAAPVVVVARTPWSDAVRALLSTLVAGAEPATHCSSAVAPFQLVEANSDIVLAHAEEAADAEHDLRHPAGLVQNDSLMSPIFSLPWL